MNPIVRERRLYYFDCAGCEQKRFSFFRSRAKGKQCRKCRRAELAKASENQMALFATPSTETPID